MIKSAKIAKEVEITVVNKIGVLADISRIIADSGINIRALTGYALDNKAVILLVSDENVRVMDALKKEGYKALKEKEVVLVELGNKVGALKGLTARLAENEIDIKRIYGSACSEGCPALLVLSTRNNDKAVVAFKKK